MIETHPKITIVTVTFNAAAVLEKTMLSVINQTYNAVEYIIVDGGSTDGTIEIIKKHENRLFHWISEPDKGIYNAMNKGIRLATGDWICFMNAGDAFADNTIIQKVVDELDAADIIYGDILIENADGAYREKIAKEPCNLHKMYFSHQSAFAKTALLRQYPFDEQYKICADYKFFKQCAHAHCQFKHVRFPVAVFDMSGISSMQRENARHENVAIIKELDKGWDKFVFLVHLYFAIYWKKLSSRDQVRW
ncbi:hypothetical protein AGMMS4957_11090 [Bacteroidia bacterium]|nr:hypothetical protein AGMMS4957_11090 [Bacteroidia bacterium]